MARKLCLWLPLILVSLAGCSSKSYFAEAEHALDTSGYFHVQDHVSNYYPSGISLNFPGYVVGFEETDASRVTRGREDIILGDTISSAGFTVGRLLKQLRYDVPFVTHIMSYQGQSYGEGNCALYSLYHKQGSAVVDSCNDDPRNRIPADYDYRKAFSRSWDAIDILSERLRQDVESDDYTHIVVAVMGLDTPQEIAIRNYRSIISSTRKQAGDDFRPLFIGITWPSFFTNRWFDPLWETLAYPPIADRADILGLTWLGVILNEVVMPLGETMPISIIAHSLGARAASMALCVGPALIRSQDQPGKMKKRGRINDFIGLAPAFSLRRFIDEDRVFYEDVYYPDYCPAVERFVFTASANDGAFAPVFWSTPAGDFHAMKKYCAQEHSIRVFCTGVNDNGIASDPGISAKVLYVDTSALMRYSMPGTRGRGHSDIYRPEIGRLLWSLIGPETK